MPLKKTKQKIAQNKSNQQYKSDTWKGSLAPFSNTNGYHYPPLLTPKLTNCLPRSPSLDPTTTIGSLAPFSTTNGYHYPPLVTPKLTTCLPQSPSLGTTTTIAVLTNPISSTTTTAASLTTATIWTTHQIPCPLIQGVNSSKLSIIEQPCFLQIH